MAVKMTHPKTDLEIQVEAEMVKTYATQGWEKKPTAKAPDKGDDK